MVQILFKPLLFFLAIDFHHISERPTKKAIDLPAIDLMNSTEMKSSGSEIA